MRLSYLQKMSFPLVILTVLISLIVLLAVIIFIKKIVSTSTIDVKHFEN